MKTLLYLVDGEICSLNDIIQVNVHDEDTLPMDEEEIVTLCRLKVGEKAIIGMVEVERITDGDHVNKPADTPFHWQDKTGRDESGNMSLENILAAPDEQSWTGQSLHEWAKEAGLDDVWENSTDKYTYLPF